MQDLRTIIWSMSSPLYIHSTNCCVFFGGALFWHQSLFGGLAWFVCHAKAKSLGGGSSFRIIFHSKFYPSILRSQKLPKVSLGWGEFQQQIFLGGARNDVALVSGFNPSSEKYYVKLEISPNRDEHKNMWNHHPVHLWEVYLILQLWWSSSTASSFDILFLRLCMSFPTLYAFPPLVGEENIVPQR